MSSEENYNNMSYSEGSYINDNNNNNNNNNCEVPPRSLVAQAEVEKFIAIYPRHMAQINSAVATTLAEALGNCDNNISKDSNTTLDSAATLYAGQGEPFLTQLLPPPIYLSIRNLDRTRRCTMNLCQISYLVNLIQIALLQTQQVQRCMPEISTNLSMIIHIAYCVTHPLWPYMVNESFLCVVEQLSGFSFERLVNYSRLNLFFLSYKPYTSPTTTMRKTGQRKVKKGKTRKLHDERFSKHLRGAELYKFGWNYVIAGDDYDEHGLFQHFIAQWKYLEGKLGADCPEWWKDRSGHNKGDRIMILTLCGDDFSAHLKSLASHGNSIEEKQKKKLKNVRSGEEKKERSKRIRRNSINNSDLLTDTSTTNLDNNDNYSQSNLPPVPQPPQLCLNQSADLFTAIRYPSPSLNKKAGTNPFDSDGNLNSPIDAETLPAIFKRRSSSEAIMDSQSESSFSLNPNSNVDDVLSNYQAEAWMNFE
jgi:hypothetical protein